MTDVDLSADDIGRLLRAATDTIEPAPDAWERLLPRLAADVRDDAGAAAGSIAHEGAVVIDIDAPGRRPGRAPGRRRLPAVAAAVAATVLAGLALTVPRLAGQDLADGGDVPWFVLGEGTDRFRVLAASTDAIAEPEGSTLLLADATGARGYLVRTVVPAPGSSLIEAMVPGSQVTTAPGPAGAFTTGEVGLRTVTVNGLDANLVEGGSGASAYLTWTQAGTEIAVSTFGADPGADELLAVGRGLTVDDDGVPSASFVPAGLRVAVRGDTQDVTPRVRYSIDYGAEDLDAPYDDSVSITVSSGGEPDLVPAVYGGVIDATFRDVQVRGRPGRLSEDAPVAALVWREPGGITVTMGSLGLTADELATLADGLRSVDENDWRAGNRAVLGNDGAGSVASAVLARGSTADRTWTVLDGGPSAGLLCLTLSVTDTTEAGGCTEGSEPLRTVASAPTESGWWVLYALATDVATVTVEEADGTEVVRVDAVEAGTAGRVAVVRLDPATADGLVAVARTADGTERSRLAATGVAAQLVDPVAIADLEGLTSAPVVVSGELEGRAWSARARAVGLLRATADGVPEPVPGDSLCAAVDFAARRDLGLVCVGDGSPLAGTLAVGVVDRPRRFVVLLLAPGSAAPTARLADGTTVGFTTAEVPDADGRRVAVLAVARTATVVAIDVGDGARTVEVPGDPDRPVTLG